MRKDLVTQRLTIAVLGLSTLLACTVALGDTLSDVAQRFGTAVQEEVAQAHSSEDSDYLYEASQRQEGPEDSGSSALWSPDISKMDPRLPVDAPLRSDPKARNRVAYDSVINQFAVDVSPRYRPDANYTYCNIFVWDVTRAMGAEIPRWFAENGAPLEPWFADGEWKMQTPASSGNANDNNRWLNQEGLRYGWREVSAKEAQDLANLGHPTVVSVYEPYEDGHIGIVRPGTMLNGPVLAQAGPRSVNYAHVYDFFPRENTQFFAHD